MLPLDITHLQSQVISLELAKKLKVAGVPQSSLFYWKPPMAWTRDGSESHVEGKPYKVEMGDINNCEHNGQFSAFTVSDLGELLSMFTTMYFGIERHSNNWRAGFLRPGMMESVIFADTQAEALGELLLYALKKGLIRF